jgi:hypothetical protein
MRKNLWILQDCIPHTEPHAIANADTHTQSDLGTYAIAYCGLQAWHVQKIRSRQMPAVRKRPIRPNIQRPKMPQVRCW